MRKIVIVLIGNIDKSWYESNPEPQEAEANALPLRGAVFRSQQNITGIQILDVLSKLYTQKIISKQTHVAFV